MILIRKVAIIFFDILDYFVHQKRIVKYFKSSLTKKLPINPEAPVIKTLASFKLLLIF